MMMAPGMLCSDSCQNGFNALVLITSLPDELAALASHLLDLNTFLFMSRELKHFPSSQALKSLDEEVTPSSAFFTHFASNVDSFISTVKTITHFCLLGNVGDFLHTLQHSIKHTLILLLYTIFFVFICFSFRFLCFKSTWIINVIRYLWKDGTMARPCWQ